MGIVELFNGNNVQIVVTPLALKEFILTLIDEYKKLE